MRRNEMFPSKFLKHDDLADTEWTLTIGGVEMEELKSERGIEHKPVVAFRGAEKRLVLNLTNYDSIAAAYGEDTDAWTGKKIILYPDETQFGRKLVNCIRVRVPNSGMTVRQAAQEAQAPIQPEATLAEELNDSLSF